MWEEILKGFSLVYLPSMLKFIFGPLAGYAAGLSLLTTIIGTTAGMMTVVFVFTYFGEWLRVKVFSRFTRNKTKSEARKIKFAALWKRYGLHGIALLTPIFLTPIGGTLLAVSSGSPKEKIIFYMFISAAVWSVIFSMTIYFFGNEILPDFIKP